MSLYDRYLQLREQTQGQAGKPLRVSRALAETRLAEMAAWCEARGYDPHRWLEALFVVRQYKSAPALRSSILTAPRTAGAYEAVGLDGDDQDAGLIETLYDEYVRYWQACGNIRRAKAKHPLAPPSLNGERRGVLKSLILWCRDRGVEPRSWLWFLFKRRSWLYHVPLRKGDLESEKLLEPYGEADLARFAEQSARKAEAVEHRYDPRRDLNPAVEAVKERLVARGLEKVCMEDLDQHLGFHPKSTVCSNCPVARECASILAQSFDFDILAVRRGDTPLEVALGSGKRR